tara:strand:- start:1185 stop:2042 length:858 start_codon:yes stop_codon:yes gene_type:complete
MGHRSKVLVTGAHGFTGRHLIAELTDNDYQPFPLISNLLDREQVAAEILSLSPDYVVHLAALSYSDSLAIQEIYQVNVSGSLNILEALSALNVPPINVVLASSATVYGNCGGVIDEQKMPAPINHYGCSKVCMEYLSKNYIGKFPITVTRPFNYTGVGHGDKFVIPKIVKAYKNGKRVLDLGNLDVFREYNDVRDVNSTYRLLMESTVEWNLVNICSGQAVSLLEIIERMDNIAGYKMEIRVNPDFVRKNEISQLSGDPTKLISLGGLAPRYTIQDTLEWMYFHE